jgi:hypothetical protein
MVLATSISTTGLRAGAAIAAAAAARAGQVWQVVGHTASQAATRCSLASDLTRQDYKHNQAEPQRDPDS